MPIIHLGSNADETFPDGAYCPIGGSYNTKNDLERYRSSNHRAPNGMMYGPVVLYTTHHGLCLAERERNMYDDSDFYMTVWISEKGAAEEILFASTRGWTYPCMASCVDASPDVIAAWVAWEDKERRRARVMGAWSRRKDDWKLARETGLASLANLARLREAFRSVETFEAAIKLLKTKKFRSDFRASLARQIRAWIDDPAPKYASPLSPKQLQQL